MSQAEIYLKKNEDKRLRKGHLWVFSNEVDTKRSPLEQFSPGDLVQIKSDDGKIMGTAYVNPQTLICARLLSRKPNLKCGVNFFKDRLASALALREKLFDKPYRVRIVPDSLGKPRVCRQTSSVYNIPSRRVPIPDRQSLHAASYVSHPS